MKLVLLIQCLLVAFAESARILGVFPVPSPSHVFLGNSLMKGLADKGHDVTIITALGDNYKPKQGTYREIVVKEEMELMKNNSKVMNLLNDETHSPLNFIPKFLTMIQNMTILALECQEVQDLLKSNEKFDVVIVEQFLNDALKGFANHFKAPLILFSPAGANNMINSLVGNPSPPSYVSDPMLNYSSNMSFIERLINSIWLLFQYVLYHWMLFPRQEEIYNKYFPNNDPFYDVLYNISLVFLVSHASIQQPVPLVPNMIEIGGLHVKPPKKLPKDLQDFMDNAKEGVIYFSMGSNLKSKDLPLTKRSAILNTFSKLKQKVIWKWEEDDLPGKPDNVKIGKWLPQQDILAHPNIKLFVTHGGLSSTTETIYHGVPVLAIPIAADQQMNAKVMVNGGFAVSLKYSELNEETFAEKLSEALNNPSYGANAKKRSELFHDRVVPPLETGIFWVEYVIRHKGAPHLKVTGIDLPWYQYYLFDLFVFFGVLFYIVIKGVKYIVCKCFGKKAKPKQKQQ